MSDVPLSIEERLRRKMARPARTQSVATRFTKPEEAELVQAAKRAGKTVREWTRDALLQEARRSPDDPIFTEIVATRILLLNLLKPLILGQKVSQEWLTEALSTVKREKRNIAREVLQQYIGPAPKES